MVFRCLWSCGRLPAVLPARNIMTPETDQDATVESCPVCGEDFEADPTGRRDRTELNLGKPAGYCSLGCRLEGEE